jgi:uncharacterized integral membrane protein
MTTDPASSEPQKPPTSSPAPSTSPGEDTRLFTRVSAAWVAIGAALLLLVLIIIFILQNSMSIKVHYLGLALSLPLGMAILIAAVGGGVLVAIAGTARIAQLRNNARQSQQLPQD